MLIKDKIWRIRDAVHNLIEFDGLDSLELRLWRVIQTAPFQRLRRIKQLGFSEFVYPGATHTRFAHSLGVFHTARRLVAVIKKFEQRNKVRYDDQHAAPALAAALLHDVGHGMFSHAFEKVGKDFGWTMANHEDVSQIIVKSGEIADILNDYSPHFADNVAEILKNHKDKQLPANIFHAVVSGQFDADRLDYMQRDRLMTGVGSSQVDVEWLFANLEVGDIGIIQEGEKVGTFQTLILGSKAQQTAENYLFSLFHLYPNVYLHKATRGFEALFQAFMRHMVFLVQDKKIKMLGLPGAHPLVNFIREPANLDNALALDDNVFWGALSYLTRAKDAYIKKCAIAFKGRQPLRTIDIRIRVEAAFDKKRWENGAQQREAVDAACERVIQKIKDLQKDTTKWFILPDSYSRPLYKEAEKDEKNAYLNQIFIHKGENSIKDIRDMSAAIRYAAPYNICRAYIFRDEREEGNRREVEDIIKKEVSRNA